MGFLFLSPPTRFRIIRLPSSKNTHRDCGYTNSQKRVKCAWFSPWETSPAICFNSVLLNCLDSRFIQVQDSNSIAKQRKSYEKTDTNFSQKEMIKRPRTSGGSWSAGYQWKGQTVKWVSIIHSVKQLINCCSMWKTNKREHHKLKRSRGAKATKQKVHAGYFPWISLITPLCGLPNNSAGVMSVTSVIYVCSLANCLLHQREEKWHFESIKVTWLQGRGRRRIRKLVPRAPLGGKRNRATEKEARTQAGITPKEEILQTMYVPSHFWLKKCKRRQ